MLNVVRKINEIFTSVCSYETINKLGNKKLRNIKNGISLNDAMFYRFQYTKKGYTKESIIGDINYNKNDNKSFDRTSYHSKEANIPIEAYRMILNKIIELYNTCNINKEEKIFVAVDGSYNMDNQKNVMLNMGYYNIKNKIPLDLTCDGTENRNREVQTLLQ